MEVDRQHIRRRIAKLKRDIKTLAKTRDLKRSRRQDSGIPQVAIVGYTNAGKSTLMNRLTGAEVVVADQLFATLDPTTRRIALPGRRRAVISDTVGFVGKLPHDLVEAFRSTLEEVALADLIVHVADATSSALDEQVDAVRRVLGEIGAGGIPELLALNKIDRVAGSARARLAGRFPGSVAVSALTGEGADGLLEEIGARVPHPPVEVLLLVPFGREDVTARLYREAEVLSKETDTDGTLIRARVGLRLLSAIRGFVREGVLTDYRTSATGLPTPSEDGVAAPAWWSSGRRRRRLRTTSGVAIAASSRRTRPPATRYGIFGPEGCGPHRGRSPGGGERDGRSGAAFEQPAAQGDPCVPRAGGDGIVESDRDGLRPTDRQRGAEPGRERSGAEPTGAGQRASVFRSCRGRGRRCCAPSPGRSAGPRRNAPR